MITLGAVGDIAFRYSAADMAKKYGLGWPFEAVRDELRTADVLFGNFETVMLPPEYPRAEIDPRGIVVPFDDDMCAEILHDAGFDFLNLAENHVLDAGTAGLFHTRKVLEEKGLRTGGVGSDQCEARRLVKLERQGLVVGFLCYCEDGNYTLGTFGPCHAYYELETVLADVMATQSTVDILIVSIHADLEFMDVPSRRRRDEFRQIAAAGADVVLGHHPHVVQGCERYGKSLIAYSLGNFLFPAYSSSYMAEHLPATAISHILFVDLDHDGVQGFCRKPVEIGNPPKERPRLTEPDRALALQEYFKELDDALHDDEALDRKYEELARELLRKELRRLVRVELTPDSRVRRAVAKLLRLWPTAHVKIDTDRLVDEYVGRLGLTAENRNWVDLLMHVGEARWRARRAQYDYTYHRPEFYLRR